MILNIKTSPMAKGIYTRKIKPLSEQKNKDDNIHKGKALKR